MNSTAAPSQDLLNFIEVDRVAQEVLTFSNISRGFLTDVPKHLRLCYFMNLLNSLSYLFTFAINQPNLILPSPFALFRGVLRNRFGAVGLTVSWANVISGVLVTLLMRLYADRPMTKLQRIALGTAPYLLFHVTAILPIFVYVVFTMNYMDETHLSLEDLSLFKGREWLIRSGGVYYFPVTELSKVYSLVQFASFGVALVVAAVVFVKQLRCQLKFAVQTSFHMLAVILTLLAPWTAVFAALYARPPYGMEIVTISWIVTFFYPLLEICCLLNYLGSWSKLMTKET
ncbi:hypothetical protein M3Y99_00039900 [Aphelenchoides fujianensis]|nr:hypothetical protein M3Y99_00039900 [Aphelenchoides fujianensis]